MTKKKDLTYEKHFDKLYQDMINYEEQANMGMMDEAIKDTVKEKGWEPDPFDGLKILKGEMDYYYDSDPEIQKSEEKIHYYKTMVDTLLNIVDTLKWRHQTIKNMIDWKKFESGS